ncbi:MAG: acetate/propionate family kinase [Aeromicrobium sp.]|nr:acetate/propionate family kinase [Aeromicrobium sp.]
MRILVVNAGSSSLKLSLLDGADVLEHSVNLAAGDAPLDTDALAEAVRGWSTPDVVAHRVVHGGNLFTGATRIEGQVRDQLQELTDLAPLHQPKSLAGIDAVTNLLPDVPAVACFDTAFHTSIPAAASTYAVPEEWRRRWAIKRYGFHGLSHAYASRRAAELVDRPVEELRIVTCHLGAGASLCAVVGGQSIDTTMGFTPLEGLVMATRSGTVDPGLVLWLEEHEHLAPHEVAQALEHRSGLAALAGTSDMREIQARAGKGDADASLALDVFIHSLAAHVAAMTASTAGLDVLVFTGGVGENSAVVRRRAAERLTFLGVDIDDELNDSGPVDLEVTADGALVRAVVVAAREDLQMSRETRLLVDAD